MNIDDLFELMVSNNASDLFLRADSLIKARIDGIVKPVRSGKVGLGEVEELIRKIPVSQVKKNLKEKKSCEFAFWYKKNWRFRVGIFYQRSTPAAVIRKINLNLNSFEELNLPVEVFSELCRQRRGLVLLTGATGSGKSTAIAAMLEHINNSKGYHILTVEEPIEFTFEDKLSIINQREIGKDVSSYAEALRQFALHSSDVMFIGNIRDVETCHAALTAAETGVLVLSTIHTVNASSTIKRIVNFFPPYQQNLVRTQLSSLLKGVISLRLLPLQGGGLVPAYEAMLLSPSISRLIRENKISDIPKYIASGDIYGMKTFNQSLLELAKAGKVSPEIILDYSDKKEDLEMELRNQGIL